MQPVLEARGIKKGFGQVQALKGANFQIKLGEIVALIGDNGAGKSTLVKILSGALQPDSGEILIDNKQVELTSTNVARSFGIETVYQNLAIANHLTPVENMFLGREIFKTGILGVLKFLDEFQMKKQASEVFDRLN